MPPNDGQAGFTAALLDPDRPAPAGVIAPDGKAPGKRFDVYRNNVIVSLSENIATAHPMTVKVVGEDFFMGMARDYVRAHPPKSPLMLLYGEDFPDFIVGFAPAAGLPYLADIARIDRAWLEAYHSADAAPLSPEAFGAVAPERLGECRLILHPATRVVDVDHSALSIWAHLRSESDEPLSVASAPESALVTRPDLSPQVYAMPPGGAAFLRALEGCAALSEAAGDAAIEPGFDLGTFLGLLLQTGALCSLEDGQSNELGS